MGTPPVEVHATPWQTGTESSSGQVKETLASAISYLEEIGCPSLGTQVHAESVHNTEIYRITLPFSFFH